MVLSGTKLAGSDPENGRIDNDFYATDPKAASMFMVRFMDDEDIAPSRLTILEPAVGQGHLLRGICEEVLPFSIDTMDIVDRGYPDTCIGDFLTASFYKSYSLVITNPPFKLAAEFIEKMLEVSSRYVVVFAKIQLLEGADRYDLFQNSPLKTVYVHSKRAQVFPNGQETNNGKKWASTMTFAWFVFDKFYSGEPTIKWLN